MIKVRYHVLLVGLFVLSGLVAKPKFPPAKHELPCRPQCEETCKEKPKPECKSFKHNIQLQATNEFGLPVAGTEFWITLQVIKEGPMVTLQVPFINFQIPESGGYLSTTAGFLPEEIQPTAVMPPSILAVSNNGLSPVYSFPPEDFPLPQPPVGYIVQVTSAGELQVQEAGVFGNVVVSGPQVLMPCSISYLAGPEEKLHKNVKVSAGATNITQFPFPQSDDALRDSHVNDAFDNVVAYAWTDNSMIADQANGTLNAMVAVGKVGKDGKLKMHKSIQLTDLPAGILAWDTAVAINRSNPDNIVVSYGVIDDVNGTSPPCRAVSFDGGKTWGNGSPYVYTAFLGSISGNTLTVTDMLDGSLAVGDVLYSDETFPSVGIVPGTVIIGFQTGTGGVGTYTVNIVQNVSGTLMVAGQPLNGPVQIIPGYSFGFGDNRGVAADKFGNIWYCATSIINSSGFETNQPYFAVSTNDGRTFKVVYMVPEDPSSFVHDYPQYCFGGDGLGNYGLWFQTSTFSNQGVYPNVGFVKIPGLITPADLPLDSTFTPLQHFVNSCVEDAVTASVDGRLWLQGLIEDGGFTYIQPTPMLFKSPGAVDLNYAGTWQFVYANQIGRTTGNNSGQISQPTLGYFSDSTQSIVYDDARQALYAVVCAQNPNMSQNMFMHFSISRDNGMTWSDPILINSDNFANRGFQSMALDAVTGNLLFGWYDGRNDPTYQSVEYYGAVIPAKKLDKMVKAIPLSNPNFQVPSAA